MKILYVIKFNNHEAFVLDGMPPLVYTKIGNTNIVGTNGVLADAYTYERPTAGFKAFGGREFEINLSDGSTEKCNGQWWAGLRQPAIDFLGGDLCDVTVQTLDNLNSCYVYCGYFGITKKIEVLRAAYVGKIWGYWEFEAFIKGKRPWRNDRVDFRRKKNYKRFNVKFYAGN